jgi:diacylglycerol kinase (ATP)
VPLHGKIRANYTVAGKRRIDLALRKPKYSLFRNSRYAINGLIEITKHERSFRLQLLLFLVMSVIAWLLPIEFAYSGGLFVSLMIPLMAEIANSAVERVVDLVTHEHHELAMRAKDAGAALVFMSLVFTAMVWIVILLIAFNII